MPELKGNAVVKRTAVYGGTVSKKTLSAVIKTPSGGGGGGGCPIAYIDENDILVFPDGSVGGLEVV